MITDTGTTLRCIRAFSSEINQLLCSLNSAKTFVASTTNQIKIYDLDKFAKKSQFLFRNDLRIKFVRCVPHDDKVLAILQNDMICILSDMNALKLIRHYDPLRAREKFLRKSNHKIEMLTYEYDDMSDDEDKIIKSVTRDYQNGIITDVSFHPDGNAFCVAFMNSDSVSVHSASMWDCRRVIAYPDFYVKQCQFFSHRDEFRKSNILLSLTSNNDLMLTCLDELNSKMLIEMKNVLRFILSSNGRMLTVLQHSGEIFVYNFEKYVNNVKAMSSKRIIANKSGNGNAIGASKKHESASKNNDNQHRCNVKHKEFQMKVICISIYFF
jgi:WD40 repeat protein